MIRPPKLISLSPIAGMGFLVIALASPSLNAAHNSDTPHVWTPDSKAAASLEPAEEFDSYLVQPPLGFSRTGYDIYKDSVRYEWTGATRPDATRPVIDIYIEQLTPDLAQDNPVQHGIDLLEKGGRNKVTSYVRTTTETGMVDGVWVSRFYNHCRFSGAKVLTDLQAANYVWIDGGHLIMVTAFDADKYWKDMRPQLEAAIMSVHAVPNAQPGMRVTAPAHS